MHTLTRRQLGILRFIIGYMKRESAAPTFKEIGEACGGIRHTTVYEHIQALDRKGYILRDHKARRTIRVLHDPDHPDVCPSCQRPFAEGTDSRVKPA